MPTVNSNGTPIYYETKGEGAAIVFAHGAGGNAAIWFNQVAHFSPDYKVIVFDHRGFGRTPGTGASFTARQFRDDLLAILDTEKISAAHLVGQSMGGFTILRTAFDTPDRVASLTMSATPGGIVNPNPAPAMQKLTASAGSDASGLSTTMSAATKQRPELMQLYESIGNFNSEFRWSNLAHLLGPEGAVQFEALAAVRCPTLFIAGAEDPLFPPELLGSYVPHFPNARIEVVANSGHSPYFEQPEKFNVLLAQHIQAAAHS